MKNNTHTQEPWTYELKSYENGESFFQIIGTPNGLEENIPHRGAFIAKVTGNKERRKANARLIAAAPDLLAALKLCADKLALWPEGSNPEFFPSLKAARAALAKAEGQA